MLYFQLEFLYHINRVKWCEQGMWVRACVYAVVPLLVNDGVRGSEWGHGALRGGFDGADVVVVCEWGWGGGGWGDVRACVHLHVCLHMCSHTCVCTHACVCTRKLV